MRCDLYAPQTPDERTVTFLILAQLPGGPPGARKLQAIFREQALEPVTLLLARREIILAQTLCHVVHKVTLVAADTRAAWHGGIVKKGLEALHLAPHPIKF